MIHVSMLEFNRWISPEVLLFGRGPQSGEWKVHIRRTGPNPIKMESRHLCVGDRGDATHIPVFLRKVYSIRLPSSSCLTEW